ncbi:MAG TPA: hypothetical protein PK668_12880 [Myxococcota bacterium]|nr:hypothetical protein [Myxococcota bacterium]HRY93635.1 hypothetical protein [Myxococcota bacterium]HSA23345.1 hypothetical protein [Myxococcota bacterium]
MTSRGRGWLGITLAWVLILAGCGGGGDETCTPEARTACVSGVIYWVNSCGELGEALQDCECGCGADGLACLGDCPTTCADGDRRCTGEVAEICVSNAWQTVADCASASQLCEAGQCVGCRTGQTRCALDVVEVCSLGSWGAVLDCAATGQICVDAAYQPTCVPDCAGRNCGLDPVCGESCGECQAGEECSAEGVCLGLRVVLSADASELMADDQSTAALTAEVFLPGGAPAGAGVTVDFTTDLGTFSESNTPIYTVGTDAEGRAHATFQVGSNGGLATVYAAIYLDGQHAHGQAQINVRQVGSVELLSADTLKLGVLGSGVNETSQVTFLVKDTAGLPFEGVQVDFTLSPAPGVAVDPRSTLTDGEGLAVTTLRSGTMATIVRVTAEAIVGNVQIPATSPAFAIVGARPSQGQFTFVCEENNVGGFNRANVQTACTVWLADRFNNKIGFPTWVLFTTEAGQIESSVQISDSGPDMGSAVTTIRTGDNIPEDVAPFPGEPFVGAGPLFDNPRDGLVTILAYTVGEEEFTDLDGDGQYDPGEPFVDVGEPLLDKDDDGIYTAEEACVDSNSNGEYDGPNGQWDGETLIWASTWMVWSGRPDGGQADGTCAGSPQGTYLCPDLDFTYPDLGWGFAWLCPGFVRTFTYGVSDDHLNPINPSLVLDAVLGQELALQASAPELPYTSPDLLGVDIGYTKRAGPDAASPECAPTDEICYQVLGVGGWTDHQLTGQLVVAGPAAEPPAPAATSVSLHLAYRESAGEGDAESLDLSVPGYAGVYDANPDNCQ